MASRAKKNKRKQGKLDFFLSRDKIKDGADGSVQEHSLTSSPSQASSLHSAVSTGGQGKSLAASPTLAPSSLSPGSRFAVLEIDAPDPSVTLSPRSSVSASPSSSPAKQKQRLQHSSTSCTGHDQLETVPSSLSSAVIPDAFSAFQTSDIPVTGTLLKDMLTAFQLSMQHTFSQLITPMQSSITEVEGRVSHIEQKMGDFATSHNHLIDGHYDLVDELEKLRTKVTDLEDRSRRNNVKFRGVAEEISSGELTPYLQNLIRAILPDVTLLDITIDRAHRVPKPAHLPDSVPRDVLARLHFFQVKDSLMAAVRKRDTLPSPFQNVKIFADLSAATLKFRRSLYSVTQALRDLKIPYRWGFPAKLLIHHNGVYHPVSSAEDGTRLLRSWDILVSDVVDRPKPPACPVDSNWQAVSSSRKPKR